MNKSPIRWSSPIYLDSREGLALAILVRLVGTCEEKPDGTVEFNTYAGRNDPLPSTFTMEMVEHVVRPFSFMRYHIRSSASVRSDEDVLEMIRRMTDEAAEAWYATHRSYIEDVRIELRKLVVGGHSLGFRVVD